MSGKFVTRVLAGWCAVGLIALAGCGGEEPSRTVDLDGESTESAAPEATEESADEVLGEPREGELTRAESAASTPEEREVAEAWFTYLEEFVRVLGAPDPLARRLGELAHGSPVDGPRQIARELAARGERLGGGMVATLVRVEIADGTAVIDGCLKTSMVSVDADNNPLVELDTPWITSRHEMVQRGDGWRVETHTLDQTPSCL